MRVRVRVRVRERERLRVRGSRLILAKRGEGHVRPAGEEARGVPLALTWHGRAVTV